MQKDIVLVTVTNLCLLALGLFGLLVADVMPLSLQNLVAPLHEFAGLLDQLMP
jgi:hypothetical protein